MSSESAKQNAAGRAFLALAALTALGVLAAIHVIFYVAPTELSMGIVQKIFYFHVPAAYGMYLGAIACLVGSAGYLLGASERWDAFARAGAEVAVAFGLVVLTTGPLWARKAWGTYWTWDPRLTTSLLSFMIYVSYHVLRTFAGDGEAERKFAAAVGILGAANLPIIHYSVQKWGGVHPNVISKGGGGLGHPAMKQALALGFVAFSLLAALLLWTRYGVARARARVARAEEEAMQLGLDEVTS